ncbi:hypothetical protein [Solwaraspora sp. WMMA2101]|uniref:hypothetical protein n=1 Tax=Solwaraspora sp. WMMA2101 TaxID=3404124 RepID=UPI003B926808
MFTQRQIHKLVDKGDQARAGGDLAEAAHSYQDACQLAGAAAAQDPSAVDHQELLGRIQLALGDVQHRRGDNRAAVDTLTAAESTWEMVAELRGASAGDGMMQIRDIAVDGLPGSSGGPVTERILADVAIIRARAHAELGHPFSGLVDAQQALYTYVVHAQSADPPSDFDQALTATGAGYVQMKVGGDPEIVAAAAGYAVSRYAQSLATVQPWQREAAWTKHWDEFRLAVDVAYIAYRALGQHDLAEAVRRLVDPDHSGRPDAWEDAIDQLRQRPTLPAVLAELAPDLKARLPGLAAASLPLVPLLRVRLAQAPDVAVQLARLSEAALDRGDPRSGMRLALDAHVLFAGTSQLGTAQLRYQFHRYGPAWCRVLYRAGRQWHDDGQSEVAVDAANWLTGLVSSLFPHAIVDAGIRSLLRDCLRWQRELYSGLGDTQAVADVTRAEETLATLGGTAAG